MSAGSTKDRMIRSAVRLLSERGVQGLTIDAVLADSGAPRGSVYHHFPGGRHAILLAAAQSAIGNITPLFAEAAAQGDPMIALEKFGGMWRRELTASNFAAGCPIAALTTAADDDELVDLAREAFDRWRRDLARAIESTGVPPEEALASAGVVISSIEGVLPLCRAYRSAEPLDTVIEQMGVLLTRSGQVGAAGSR